MRLLIRHRLFAAGLLCFVPLLAQQPVEPEQARRQPDLAAQRTAMRKLSFLTGAWSGQARLLRVPSQSQVLSQTRQAEFRLDGLVLMLEGTTRNAAERDAVFQTLAIICYDDENRTYQMRSYENGVFLETELKLSPEAKELAWQFTSGPVRTATLVRVSDRGEWIERTQIMEGAATLRPYRELSLRRRK